MGASEDALMHSSLSTCFKPMKPLADLMLLAARTSSE
jgi:hypothetical protein